MGFKKLSELLERSRGHFLLRAWYRIPRSPLVGDEFVHGIGDPVSILVQLDGDIMIL